MRRVKITCLTPGYEFEYSVMFIEDNQVIKHVLMNGFEYRNFVCKNWIEYRILP
jgi:hypothetical protein